MMHAHTRTNTESSNKLYIYIYTPQIRFGSSITNVHITPKYIAPSDNILRTTGKNYTRHNIYFQEQKNYTSILLPNHRR
jgi:hypothetical protein